MLHGKLVETYIVKTACTWNTVPTQSVCQSQVTGSQVKMNGHGCHGSQQGLMTMGEPKAFKKGNLDVFLVKISPRSLRFLQPDENDFLSGQSQVTPHDKLIVLVQYAAKD